LMVVYTKKFSSFFLLSTMVMIAGCSASINPMYGKHKDDPKDFIDRRDVAQNDFIESGGFKKKNKSAILPGQETNQAVIPDNSDLMVGSVGYDDKKAGNQEEQVTYTFSKLKSDAPPADSGFSKQRLNISNETAVEQKVSFLLKNDIYNPTSCADKQVQKEIDDATISKKEFEKAKERDIHLF
jgi:hypothetical protein